MERVCVVWMCHVTRSSDRMNPKLVVAQMFIPLLSQPSVCSFVRLQQLSFQVSEQMACAQLICVAADDGAEALLHVF